MVQKKRLPVFIRQSFDADICDPIHYGLIPNTAQLSVEAGVEAIVGAVMAGLHVG